MSSIEERLGRLESDVAGLKADRAAPAEESLPPIDLGGFGLSSRNEDFLYPDNFDSDNPLLHRIKRRNPPPVKGSFGGGGRFTYDHAFTVSYDEWLKEMALERHYDWSAGEQQNGFELADAMSARLHEYVRLAHHDPPIAPPEWLARFTQPLPGTLVSDEELKHGEGATATGPTEPPVNQA